MNIVAANRKDMDQMIRSRFVSHGKVVNRSEWQAVMADGDDIPDQRLEFFEIQDLDIDLQVPLTEMEWAVFCDPNLPWAEDHFQERISGIPHNPPPSASWWPHNQQDNAEFKDDGKFSHTYPERFWPYELMPRGVRYPTGTFYDLMRLLEERPMTRQAYLPIWFPEDLSASRAQERVPCTLGYLIQFNSSTTRYDLWYYMRSCDYLRYMWDDIYMAGRLLQLACGQIGAAPGTLHMKIANLHVFAAEAESIKQTYESERNRRMFDAF